MIIQEQDTYLASQKKKYPEAELLTIDLHCHDHNSNVPDELLGRILNVPETWLESERLIRVLEEHGCDTFTVTNHNNARSCYELADKGIDVLTAAEFSCMVPDYRIGIHVLTYGFTPAQEEKLKNLRSDLYRFLDYTCENDIPTIWAHPLYHYHAKGVPPLEFFDKMSLLFERFEVINGQRDTWQNMLVKNWVEGMTPERLDDISRETGIEPGRYCRDPYRKSMSGGSDSHMGIFTGLTGTRLHVPGLEEKLTRIPRSLLALEAIRDGAMAPFGSHNESEKMTVSFLDYFCQIAMNMKDPGLMRILLHKGGVQDRMLGLLAGNAVSELQRHRVTMNLVRLFHDCFSGSVPHFTRRFFIPSAYKKIFDRATEMAEVRRDTPEQAAENYRESLHFIYEHLNQLFFSRLGKKLDSFDTEHLDGFENLTGMLDSLDFPSSVRNYIDPGSGRKNRKNGNGSVNLAGFLDGLSFPFLGSALILSAAFTSARVLYNSRPLLTEFSRRIGRLEHPERALWLTDTFEDTNGVAMVLKSVHAEIKKRGLPIDLLVCSSTVEADEHLIVVPPVYEATLPFYPDQPVRIPNVLDIHRIFREGKYDRVICSTEGPMGLASLFLKKAYTVPAFFYVHTDWMMFARKVLNFDHNNRSRFRRILRAYYRAFDRLFVLNSDQRKWFMGRDMGFSESQVRLTAHWAEDSFTPKNVKKEELFGVGQDQPVLLFAGRISNEKGVMELPGLFRKISESFPDAAMVIAGKGPMEKKLKEALPGARYLGWVDHEKMPELYSAADMLVLPSKFDTFGCVVLEAMSCGLPVTAYRTKGPKDIIRHGKNGFLVSSGKEMAECIKGFLEDSAAPASFRRSALERAAEFNSDTILSRFLEDIGLGN